MSDEERFSKTWAVFLDHLIQELGKNPSKMYNQGIDMVKSIKKYPVESLDKALDNFSTDHRSAQPKEEVLIESSEILLGLQAEMEAISRKLNMFEKIKKWLFGSARHYEAIGVALDSITDLLKSLPEWIKNALIFVKELFKLLKLGK